MDLGEDDRGPRPASETLGGSSKNPTPPLKRTGIFLPNSSHTHVRRSSHGVQCLRPHNRVGDIKLNHMFSSPSLSNAR